MDIGRNDELTAHPGERIDLFRFQYRTCANQRLVAIRINDGGNALQLLIEAPVNGGRNYNGPKVAKFLVG